MQIRQFPSLADLPELRAPSPVERRFEHKLLSRAVADWLASQIISGELPPGERLLETRVAESAGVSRSPVREALRLLAREGLVEIVPRLGAYVARIDAADASDLYACRILLEPLCVRDAVGALSEAEVRHLAEVRADMERAVATGDAPDFLANTVRYSRYLISRCRNGVLRELVEVTWNKSLRYWNLLVRLPNYTALSLDRHSRLHESVQALDAEAAGDAEREILSRALDEILATFAHGQGGVAPRRCGLS